MAIVGQLMRLTFGGPLFGTEQWACTLHLNGASMNGTSAAGFQNILQGWMTANGNYINGAAKLAFIKFNAINPVTGRYASSSSADTFDVTPAVSGAGTLAPGQVAVAVSLGTGIARGRGSKGRVYLPAGGQWLTPNSAGHADAGFPLAAANNMANVINSVNALTTARVVVFSKIGQLATPVTKVRCGDVLDTQRRRRTSIKEAYIASTVLIA